MLSFVMIPINTTTILLLMNNFDSEYPFGEFLEDSSFDEIGEFLQSHCQKKNAVNTMAEGNITMHSFIF